MYNVVWFKKDLRARDHAPLAAAVLEKHTFGIYVIEPEWLKSPEFDSSHYVFLQESLRDLEQDLRALGVPLVIRVGEAVEVLSSLHGALPIRALYSHEETGLDWTYQRDRRVRKWTREIGIPWREFRQFGVIRALKSRDIWLQMRNQTILRNLIEPVGQEWPRVFNLAPDPIPTLQDLKLPDSLKTHAQKGGAGSLKAH